MSDTHNTPLTFDLLGGKLHIYKRENSDFWQCSTYLAGHDAEPEQIDPADLPAVLEGLAQAKRGELATQAEVERAFRRFDG